MYVTLLTKAHVYNEVCSSRTVYHLHVSIAVATIFRVKVKFVPQQATKAQKENRCIALLFL